MATTVSAPTPEPTERTGAGLYAVVGGLMLVTLMAALDSTIVSTALPTIVGDLGGLEHISWVVTAYLLAQTVVTPLYGKLGDLYGRKRVLQVGLVIFLIGSALCGQANSMTELIAFRAIQGLGGGGLMVSAQAAIGDVVSPRQRGRYSGLFGAVFGVATVIGPLIGGFLTGQVSWRWIFYVNLPVGLIAAVVLARTLPAATERRSHQIDYLGTGLLGAGLIALVLLTTLGGHQYAWGSATIIGLGVLTVIALTLFAFAERRAAEPILPPELWRNRVFVVTSAIGFIVGFALFGSTTYLPLFQQVVRGLTPTESGLALLPLMGGLLVASIGSGQVISRTGRYKIFPIVGGALLAVGLFLLSTVSPDTSTLVMSLEMVLVGLGLGCTMQVLVLAVQNAVSYNQLGVATSGATLFRLIGGSLGTAILGAIFSSQLSSHLTDGPAGGAAGAAGSGEIDPKQVASLPPQIKQPFLQAYTDSLDTVFLVAAAVAVLAFLLAWFVKELPLRDTVDTSGVGEAFAAPAEHDSLGQISTALSRIVGRDRTKSFLVEVADEAGVRLGPAACWMLLRHVDTPGYTIADAQARLKEPLPDGVFEAARDELLAAGYVTVEDAPDDPDPPITVTPAGVAVHDQLRTQAREQLRQLLDGWSPEQYPELERLLTRLAGDYADERPEESEPKPERV